MTYALKTRIAPTPSGYLHLGNAWSFTLTWLAARSRGGTVHLRIDDLDSARFRDAYLDDIFESLRWLGLDWDTGPRDAAEFKSAYSQRLRLDRYHHEVARLQRAGASYSCACSREKIRADAAASGKPLHLYPGTCRESATARNQGGEGGPAALRYRMPRGAARVRDAEGEVFDLHPDRDVGDFVLRQKNGDPSYHLASILDDEDTGINFVVRGLDLMPSTGAQLALASALGLETFPRARFWHHSLILGDEGGKLSKSALSSEGSESLRSLRARSSDPAPLFRFFGEAMGIAHAASARDLLAAFDLRRVPTGPLYLRDFWKRMEE